MKATRPNPFGIMLRLYRRDQGLGVRGLAKLIGISHGTVSRIERGEKCDLLVLLKIINWMIALNEGGK